VPVPLFGFKYEVGLEPIHINLEKMIASFKQGLELRSIWKHFLSEATIEELRVISESSQIAFPDGLWARVVYDFAVAHHRRVMAREHLLSSLTPLYLGKVGALFVDIRDSSHADVEARIERLCVEFEQAVPYLIQRWRAQPVN
jgi:hypothetical protein